MTHKANMVNEYTDVTFFPIYAKTQPIATSTSHLIAIYIPEINTPIYTTNEVTGNSQLTRSNEYISEEQ